MGSSSAVPQTPGDPRDPIGGEPTIMAFERPANRPATGGNARSTPAHSFGGADAVPIVLRLPALTRGQQTPPPAPTVGQTRPWIGIAMWCATGALAIVAAVLIFTGKQESTSTVEEAPQWQTGPVVSDSANPSGDGANGRWGSGQPVDGSAVDGAAAREATGRSSSSQTGPFPWREHVPTEQPAQAEAAPNGAAPANTYPAGASRPPFAPGTDPGAAGGLGPTTDPGGPAGLGDPEASNGEPSDQSKLQSNVRTATRPNPAGGARLDGGIRNLEARPRYDSYR